MFKTDKNAPQRFDLWTFVRKVSMIDSDRNLYIHTDYYEISE